MDPDAALKDIDIALAAGNITLAHSLFADLARWIADGGFAPNWYVYPRAKAFCGE